MKIGGVWREKIRHFEEEIPLIQEELLHKSVYSRFCVCSPFGRTARSDMAGSDSEEDAQKSPPLKRLKGAKGAKTRSQNKAPVHELSDDGSEEGGGFSASQMKQFATLISTAMGSALASVAGAHSQNPSNSRQASGHPGCNGQDGGDHDEESQHGSEDEREPDEIDDYDKSLDSLLGNQEVKGPDLSEKVTRVLEKCLGPALDEKMVKEKREMYPKPGNVVNLSVPRLNSEIYKRISGEHQFADKAMQQIQSFMVAGLTAVGYQAENALKVRSWVNGLKEEDREHLPPEMLKLGKSYVTLMDASVLMTRAMGEITSLRRKIVKNDLVEPYKSLVDDEKNPASPSWLAGDDVHATIRKAKDNAFLADKITAKTSWPNNSNKKKSHTPDRGGFRPGFGSGHHGNHSRNNSQNRSYHEQGRSRGNSVRGRGNGTPRGRGYDNRDLYRRDSR